MRDSLVDPAGKRQRKYNEVSDASLSFVELFMERKYQ